MSDVEVIQIGDAGTVQSIQIISSTPTTGVQIPDHDTRRLDELDDVSGADAGSTGQVLTKTADGQWRPLTPSGGGGPGPGGPLSYLHTQDAPATVWLITHGLGFVPAGIECWDHTGARHYPELTYPSDGVVRLDFLFDLRGTARLS